MWPRDSHCEQDDELEIQGFGSFLRHSASHSPREELSCNKVFSRGARSTVSVCSLVMHLTCEPSVFLAFVTCPVSHMPGGKLRTGHKSTDRESGHLLVLGSITLVRAKSGSSAELSQQQSQE